MRAGTINKIIYDCSHDTFFKQVGLNVYNSNSNDTNTGKTVSRNFLSKEQPENLR